MGNLCFLCEPVVYKLWPTSLYNKICIIWFGSQEGARPELHHRHSWQYVCACVCICACMCECHRQVQSEIAHSIRAALIRKASTSCLAAKPCWWGTRGETVGNVWDTEARHSHGQYDLDSSWRVARMRPHREEGEKLHLQRPQVQPTQVLENPEELRQPAQPDLSVKKERQIRKTHNAQMTNAKLA